MSDRPHGRGPSGVIVFSLLVVWLVAYFAVRFSLEANPAMPEHTRLAIAFIPVPLFATFIWSFIRSVRDADELERRIHLETLAIAFPLGLLLLTTLGLVQRAVELDFQDWSYNHVWPMFAFFWLLGNAIARKRYS
jgi:heme/copper-type cytochrome/quinol oxidase subunit 2